MVLLNSPSNPTGAVYTKSELENLARVLAKYPDIWILSDEIYSRLVFGNAKHYSIAGVSPEMANRTIVANGVSKAFSMTGWRIGWIAAPKDLIKNAVKIQSHTVSCATSICQYASATALTESDEFLKEWLSAYERRRDLFIRLLKNIPGIKPFVPDGAFYLYCDIHDWLGKTKPDGSRIVTCLNAAEYLLESALVAAVHGAAFGMGGYMRFSFATSDANIEKGCARIAEAIKKLS
jgi:aspartate aminotransferase